MNKRIYLIILYLLTVFICIAAISHHVGNAVSGCIGCVGRWTGDYKGPYVDLVGDNIEATYDESGYTELSIKGAVADLTIEEGDGYSVYFRGDEGLKPEVNLSGKKLSIKQPSVKVPGGNTSTYSVIRITVPKDALKEIGIDSAVGDVYIKNIECETLDVKAAVGTVNVNDVECSEKTKVAAAVGEVRISDSKTGKLDIESAIGDVVLRNIDSKDTFVDSHIGDVKINGIDSDKYNFSLNCSLGDLEYNGRDYGKKHKINNITAEYEFEIKSDIGDIKIDVR